MDMADRERLIKLVGMLGSSFGGERDNAVRFIQKIAEANKITINEAMAIAFAGQAQQPPPRQDPPKPPPNQKKPQAAPDPEPEFFKIHEESELILKGLETANECPLLTPWERQFTLDVAERYDRDYELTEKQVAVAQRILGKVQRWRAW